MLVLALDASTYTGSAALIRDGALIAETDAAMRGQHEERLMPAVASLLHRARTDPGDLGAVACGGGPGSFTSLRIAASIAKGIAVARRLPLFVAPSLVLAVAAADTPLAPGTYVVLLGAMRGDVFGVTVRVAGRRAPVAIDQPWLARREDALARAAGEGAIVVGPDEPRRCVPHARGFAVLLRDGAVVEVDLSSWEPDYGRKAEAQVRWEGVHGRPLEAR